MPDFFDTLSFDDLPNFELRRVADVLGLETAKKLWRNFRGVCIPCPSRIPHSVIANYAREHFRLKTREVAAIVGVSKRTVDGIVGEVPRPARGDSRQLSLFG